MPDLFINTTSVSASGSAVQIQGEVRFGADGSGALVIWNCAVPHGTDPADVELAIANSAQAAVEATGVTMAPGDKRVILGGATQA